MNQKDGHAIGNVFLKNDLYLESDVDEQLIITIEFLQPVKLYSLQIVPASETSFSPKLLRTFVNASITGFDAAESVPCVEQLELDAATYEKKAPVQLRFVRYQNVQSLTLFVESNLGDVETTKIKGLTFFGQPINATKDLSELKKQEHEG